MLSMYVDIAKFVMGLASGSIVLLVGSTIFRSNGGGGSVLATLASPLFVLALCLIWGVFFMSSLTMDYEAYRNAQIQYTRFKYSMNLAFGFSFLACFAIGYIWLILIVTRSH